MVTRKNQKVCARVKKSTSGIACPHVFSNRTSLVTTIKSFNLGWCVLLRAWDVLHDHVDKSPDATIALVTYSENISSQLDGLDDIVSP